MNKTTTFSLFRGQLPLLVLAHFSHHLMAALLVPLMPFIRDTFNLDYTRSGMVVSAFTLAYGFSHIPAGWLSHRLDLRILITIGISGVAVFGFLIGFAPNFILLVSLAALMGIMSGGYHPSSAFLVSASVVKGMEGRALGFHQIGGTASHFVTPLIAVALANAWGWQGSFISVSIVAMIFGLLLYWSLGRVTGPLKRTETESVKPHSNQNVASSSVRVATVVGLSIVGYVLIHALMSFIPLFMVDHFNLSKEVGAGLLSLTYSAGLWAGPLGGYLSDRVGTVPVVVVGSLLTGPVIYAMNVVPYGLAIYAVLLALGMSLYMRMPVTEAYILKETSGQQQSMILGLYYFASRGGPGLVTPLLGYLIDRFDFGFGFAVVSSIMLAVTVAALFMLIKTRAEKAHNRQGI